MRTLRGYMAEVTAGQRFAMQLPGPRELLGLVMRQGLGLPALGIGTGVLAALALSRVLSSLLYGVSAADPLTYAAIVAGVAAMALLASYFPALRASRLQPARVLRSD